MGGKIPWRKRLVLFNSLFALFRVRRKFARMLCIKQLYHFKNENYRSHDINFFLRRFDFFSLVAEFMKRASFLDCMAISFFYYFFFLVLVLFVVCSNGQFSEPDFHKIHFGIHSFSFFGFLRIFRQTLNWRYFSSAFSKEFSRRIAKIKLNFTHIHNGIINDLNTIFLIQTPWKPKNGTRIKISDDQNRLWSISI